MTAKPFEAVLAGTDRAFVIAENEFFVAVLETKPLVVGHVVVVSKSNVDHFYDLPDADLSALLVFSKRIAHVLKSVVPCEKIGTAVLGLETRHAHLHLVPITVADDLNFTRAKLFPAPEALAEVLAQLKAKL